MVQMNHTTDLAAAEMPATENELSRRYLRLLEMWIPVGVEYFADWPDRPNCGHFFGGCHWYGNETVGPAEAFAAVSTSPEYDEKAVGVSRDALREMAIKGLRYLCFTHDTGPEDCVRPATGLGRPENCGTKWGERGVGFFRESQCGTGMACMARICLLLKDQIDEETWMMMARMHEDYAERFGDMPPKDGVYVDTQMEENAWTSTGLASCYLFLSRHPQAGDWEAMARRWMYSTCATPQDAKDLGPVGEETAKVLTGKIFTTLPDYWAENHGMVHPSYTGSGVRSLLTLGTQLRLWGRGIPPELYWNRDRVYESLKAMTDGGGYPQPIQGMDWPYLRAAGCENPHAIASVFYEDPDAAALQLRGLHKCELRMKGNGGRLYDPDLAMAAHGQQDPLIIRESAIGDVTHLYLFHRLFGQGAKPTPEKELEASLAGVRSYPHAGFVHHRHPAGQTSFSWRNSIMALPLTKEGIYTIAPCSDSWLGTPVVKDRPDSHRLVDVNLTRYDDAFAAAMVMDRCQESLRQQVLFASLPDGRALSFERFVALEDLILESLDQGFLRITNEHFPLLEPNCRGVRTLCRPDGSTDYRGWHGDSEEDDVVDDLGQPEWVNVDDRLGICFSGTGTAVYHNRHHFKPYRAIADDFTLSRQARSTAVEAGQSAGRLAAVLAPDQPRSDTPSLSLEMLSGPPNSAALVTDGFLAVASFGARTRRCVFSLQMTADINVYPGSALDADGEVVRYAFVLQGRSASLLRATRTLRSDGSIHVDTCEDGACYVTNVGEDVAEVEVTSGEGAGIHEHINPGSTWAL